jgi:hypothetical protein
MGAGSLRRRKTPAGWAWAQIRNDEIADFNARCGGLDPHAKKGWDHACRQIPQKFLVDVLTVPKGLHGANAHDADPARDVPRAETDGGGPKSRLDEAILWFGRSSMGCAPGS